MNAVALLHVCSANCSRPCSHTCGLVVSSSVIGGGGSLGVWSLSFCIVLISDGVIGGWSPSCCGVGANMLVLLASPIDVVAAGPFDVIAAKGGAWRCDWRLRAEMAAEKDGMR